MATMSVQFVFEIFVMMCLKGGYGECLVVQMTDDQFLVAVNGDWSKGKRFQQ